MIKFPRYRLADLLERKGNNLDLVRLICSCMVIFGHSFLLTADPAFPFGIWDPVSRYLGYEGVYMASLAVKIFFFISGLLVTNSLLRKKSIPAFLIARFLRIWPALIALLLITVFVVGPLCTNLKPAEYFTERDTYAYLWENFLMLTSRTLPGVFVSNPLSNQVNASIWTLPYEIAAYLGILLLYALRLINSRLIFSAITLLLLVDPLLPHSLLFSVDAGKSYESTICRRVLPWARGRVLFKRSNYLWREHGGGSRARFFLIREVDRFWGLTFLFHYFCFDSVYASALCLSQAR